MLRTSLNINFFDNRNFPKTITNVLTDVYGNMLLLSCKNFIRSFYSATNMSIDILYLDNIYVFGISLRK